MIGELFQKGAEPLDICLIKWCIDFIEHRKRRWTIAQKRKEQCNDSERTFTARKCRQTLLFLPRKCHQDFDAGVKDVRFVEKFYLCLAAAKQANENIRKIHLNLGKGFFELLCHGRIHIG